MRDNNLVNKNTTYSFNREITTESSRTIGSGVIVLGLRYMYCSDCECNRYMSEMRRWCFNMADYNSCNGGIRRLDS